MSNEASMKRLQDLGIALGSTALLTIVKMLAPAGSILSSPYRFTHVLVFTVAYFRGWVAGVVTTLACALSTVYFHIPPVQRLTLPTPDQWTALGLYLVECGLIVWLSHKLCSSRDRARQTARELDDVLSVASHELRNPLSAIQLQSDVLRRALPPEGGTQMRSKLDTLDRNTARLGRLITGLMDVARVSHGQLHLENEYIDLVRVAREAVERMAPEIVQARCPVAVYADAPVYGAWDRLRLEQIMTNLVSNAVKYGAGKPVEIFVKHEDSHASLVVRDHGQGLTPEQQSHLFQKFERAGADSKVAGVGLGLWIVHAIVKRMAGTIRVTSAPKQGASFRVELPFQSSPEDSREPRKSLIDTALSHRASARA